MERWTDWRTASDRAAFLCATRVVDSSLNRRGAARVRTGDLLGEMPSLRDAFEGALKRVVELLRDRVETLGDRVADTLLVDTESRS